MPNLKDYYSARGEILPFVAGDADIMVDMDLTKYTSVAEFEADNPGWTVGGTGAVFDSNGFNGKGTACLTTSTFDAATLGAAAEGTVIIEAERESFSMDEGVSNFSTTFIQSTGRNGSIDGNSYLFAVQANAYNNNQLAHFYQSNNAIRFLSEVDNVSSNYDGGNLNSQTPNGLDAFGQYAVTWKGYEVYSLVDGMPSGYAYQAGPHDDPVEFQRWSIGAQTPSAVNALGNYYIRRVQIVKRAAVPVFAPTRIAVFGDSFARATVDGEDHLTASSIEGFYDGTGRAAQQSGIQEFCRLMNANGYGIPRGIYGLNTTENGHGWASDLVPFSAATIQAVVDANPEIIIALGSVNDVADSLPTDILGDTKTIMDQFIDGCPALREIHFFEQFPGLAGWTVSNTAIRFSNSVANRAAQAGISGYRGKVIYHQTRATWDEDATSQTNPEFTIGSAPGNTKTANANLHPSTLGHLYIGKFIFDALKPYMTVL